MAIGINMIIMCAIVAISVLGAIYFFRRFLSQNFDKDKGKQAENTPNNNPPKRRKADPLAVKKIQTTCPNCDSVLNISITDCYFICPNCNCKYLPTWRELGINKDEVNPKRRTILANPNKNPAKFFGELLPPIENGIALNEDIKKSEYKGGLQYNLKWLRSEEKELHENGSCPAPRPFTNIALLARKTKNYELEIAVCKRAQELVKIHNRIVEENGIKGEIKFSQTSIYKVIERLPNALELLKKEKNQKEFIPTKQIERPTKNINKNIVLEKQCSELSIKLEYLDIDWSKSEKKYIISDIEKYKRPEDAVMALLRKDGWRGTAYEFRPLVLAMKASCFDYIEKMSKNIFMEDCIAREFNIQIYLYKLDRKTAMDMARSQTTKDILETCGFFLNCEENIRSFPLLKIEDINSVLLGIGMDKFYRLMDIVFDNPHDNVNGWPDIFAFNGENMLLVEVKTTDTMLDSQIYTWSNLIKEIDANTKIVCVRKNLV